MISLNKEYIRKDETDLLNNDFRGKLAGKAWKYEQNLDGLIRTRLLLFVMIFLVYYPIVSNFIFYDFFSAGLLIERIIYSLGYIAGFFLFNKSRNLAIILGLIPSILIFIAYLEPQYFNIKVLGFTAAIVIAIGAGFYYNFQVKKLKKELENTLLENQLITDKD